MQHFKLEQVVAKALSVSALTLFSLWANAEVVLKNEVFKVIESKNAQGEIIETWQKAEKMLPGDKAGYKISFTNKGDEPATDIVINNNIPEHTTYQAGSAQGSNTQILFSVDGKQFASADQLTIIKSGKKIKADEKDYQGVRWVLQQSLAAGAQGSVQYIVTIK